MFVSSIFDSIKVVKTHSLTLGMQNLFVLIVFIFVMHDYLSREILNQGVYALVRMHRRTEMACPQDGRVGCYMRSLYGDLFDHCLRT